MTSLLVEKIQNLLIEHQYLNAMIAQCSRCERKEISVFFILACICSCTEIF